MNRMQLREAKATLSAVVDAAENGEPTTITRNGKPAAVVVSHEEWTRLTKRIPDFAELLMAMPPIDEDCLSARKPARVLGEP